jgi:hypothetical protein
MSRLYLIIALMLLPSALRAQTYLVNDCLASSGASAVSSASCTLTVGPHHALAAFARVNGTTTFTVTSDTLGSTFVLGTTSTGVGATQRVFWTCDTGSGGPDTVNVSAAAAGQRFELDVLEYQGVPTSSCDETSTINTGTSPGNPIDSHSLTTSNANDILIGFAGMNNGGTWTAATGYTIRTLNGVGEQMVMEDRLVSSTGTYNANPTYSVNGDWVAAMIVFKQQAIASCSPTITNPYFVQGTIGSIGLGYSKSLTLPCHSSPGDKILFAFSMIQSLGNHSESVVIGDTDGNSYTERNCQDGGAGNETACVYETTATTSDLLTVTVSYTPVNDLKNIHAAMSEYQRLGAFSAVQPCQSTSGLSCVTGTPFSTPINMFYYAMGADQGADAGVTFIGPAGYTQRLFSNDNPEGAIGFGALGDYDTFLAAAQGPNYSITISASTVITGVFLGALLTYPVVPINIRRSQVY